MLILRLIMPIALAAAIFCLVWWQHSQPDRPLVSFGPEEQERGAVSVPAGIAAQPVAIASVGPEETLEFELVRADRAPPGAPAVEPTIVSSNDGRRVVVAWIDGREGDDVPTQWNLFASISEDFGTSWSESPLAAPEEGDFEFDPMSVFDPVSGRMVVGAITSPGAGNAAERVLYYHVLEANDQDFEGPFVGSSGGFDKGWMSVGRPDTAGSEFFVTLARGPEGAPFFQRSLDGGRSWTDRMALPTFENSSVPHPRYRDGALYIGYYSVGEDSSSARLLRSVDDGQTFEAFDVASYSHSFPEEPGSGIPGDFRVSAFHQIAVDPTDQDVFSVWTDFSPENAESRDFRIFFRASHDGGESWEDPSIITGSGGGDQFFPWIEVDRFGFIHLIYMDTRHADQPDTAASASMDVYYATSTDRGKHWRESRITPTSFSSDGANFVGQEEFIGDYLGLAVADHDVYLAFPYESEPNGGFDQFLARRRLGLDVSGLWYNPSQSGHGLSIHHIENTGGEQIVAAWFTFNMAGEPIWLIAQGRLSGAIAKMDALYDQSTTALFPPRFESRQAELAPWGTLEIEFFDEQNSVVRWEAVDGFFGTAELDLERLSRIQRAGPDYSGIWYDANNPGHGQFIEIIEIEGELSAAITWYAHHQGKQTWLQGTGPLTGDTAQIVFSQLRGGSRPQDFDQNMISMEPWGEASIAFTGPDSAVFSWSPTISGYPAGNIELTRLSEIRSPAH